MVLFNKNNQPIPKLLTPICDGISITLDIPIHEQSELRKNIKDSIPNYAKKDMYQVSRSLPMNKKFLPFGADKTGESNVIVQCAPKEKYKKNNTRFFRLEWNPYYVNAFELFSILDVLLPNLSQKIFEQGKITRIDIAQDVAQIKVDDCLLHYPKSTITDVKSTSGRTEYIGGNKSPTQWAIYDKKAEIIEKNKKKPVALREKVPNYELTRFEVRLRLSCTFKDLMLKKNPFEKLSVALYGNSKYKGDDVWGIFLDSCRLRGTVASLHKIRNSSFYSNYKKRITEEVVEWWTPEEIWENLPNILYEISGGFINSITKAA